MAPLNSDGICQIIREAATNGVAFLRVSSDGVEINFERVPQKEVFKDPPPTEFAPSNSFTPEPGKPEEPNEVERDPKDLEREDEVQELQLTDPLEFEERLARGDLTDVGNGSADE